MSDDQLYRTIIDALVVQCREGEGQVSARRVLAGVWNENADAADAEAEPGQHAMNVLLGSLDGNQRAVLAGLFADEFESGVYNVLRVLEAAQLPLFEVRAGRADRSLPRPARRLGVARAERRAGGVTAGKGVHAFGAFGQ